MCSNSGAEKTLISMWETRELLTNTPVLFLPGALLRLVAERPGHVTERG